MQIPSNVTLNKQKKLLVITFDKVDYHLSSEYLRVNSPSAEVVGHSPEDSILQVDKENVTITKIKPVGNYALIFCFSDGHDTGIYSWSYLYNIATKRDKIWNEYLNKLKAAKHNHSQL